MHRRCSEHHRGSSVSTGAGAMAALASVAIVAAFAAAALQLLIVGVTGAAGFMAATLGASTWAVVFGMVLVVGNAWTLQLLRAQTPYGLVTFVEQARCGFSHWQVKTGFCSALMGALNFGAGLGVGKEGPAIVLATTVSVWIRTRTPWLLDHRLATIAAVSAAVSAMFGMPFSAIVLALELLRAFPSRSSAVAALLGSAAGVLVHALLLDSTGPTGWGVAYSPVLPGQAFLTGVMLGVVSAGFTWMCTAITLVWNTTPRVRSPARAALAIGVNVAAWIAFWPLSAPIDTRLHHVLMGNAPSTAQGELLLLAAPLLIAAVCLRSSVAGGYFSPVMLGGAMAGAFFAVETGAPAESGALLGMGAAVAGVLRLPIYAVVFVVEMIGSLQPTVPMSIACLASWLSARCLHSAGVLGHRPKRSAITTAEKTT